jgi:hypothetical protein
LASEGQGPAEVYILYQIGVSDEWTWFSPVGIFLNEAALRGHLRARGIPVDLEVMEPDSENEVRLHGPQDYVAVRSREGRVPEVELDLQE